MVLKLGTSDDLPIIMFENDVKQYGTQAKETTTLLNGMFENDVKQYGTQANIERCSNIRLFENDVKQYGTQATGSGLCFTS